jgi:glycosyltransferase involved in cell wall biosynthesis
MRCNPSILHFIPQDGIGGAEIAARSATLDRSSNVRVHAMFNGLYTGKGAYTNERLTGNATRSAFSPRSLWGAIRRAAEVNPQVFVFSLWRTFGAFVALKIRYPNRKFVTFVHNERVANPIDRLLTALMVCGADEIWVDSQATMDARLSAREKRRAKIISLRLERPKKASPRSIPAPEFVYWGRLAEQKRIDRSISLFARIAEFRPDARLMLIGPDHGVLQKLERQACSAGVEGRVEFYGPRSLDEITRLTENSRFFLQLSDHEGMAMGVVEAMERGLVPVVTPVGQMGV